MVLDGGSVFSCTTATVPASLYDSPELRVFFFDFKVGRRAKYMWRIVSHLSEDDMTQDEKTILIGYYFVNIFNNDKNKGFVSPLIL